MMRDILRAVFRPHDGSRRAMTEAVTAGREDMERARDRLDRIVSNRLGDTIGEMLDQNDRLTGRSGRSSERKRDVR